METTRTTTDSPIIAAASDSAEARREARRRRILENSSNRLAKISGLEDTASKKTSNAPPTEPDTNVVHADPEIERDVYEPSSHIYQQQQQQQQHHQLFIDPMQQFRVGGGASVGGGAGGGFGQQAPQADLFASMFASMNTGSGLGMGGGAGDAMNNPFAMFTSLTNANGMDASPLLTGDLFASLLGSNAAGAAAGQQPTATPGSPPEKLSLITRLLRSKLHIAAIGTLTYLLAANDLMFRSHVFTMFLLWEAVELFVLKPYEKDRSSYLGIVFLFSGIPTEHSSVVMRWFATIRKVLKDVAIFVFFFVMAHLLWQKLVLGETLTAILNVGDDGVNAADDRHLHDYVVRRPTLVVESDVDADLDFEF